MPRTLLAGFVLAAVLAAGCSSSSAPAAKPADKMEGDKMKDKMEGDKMKDKMGDKMEGDKMKDKMDGDKMKKN